VLAWFARNRRALPWRDDPQPYRVWISEIMLQQTTVEAVRPRYERFLERFPSVEALARAPEDDVLAAWSGLGYYQRARNLHRAAAMLVRERGGALPDTAAELSRLPGVGRYTAGAIASIAFGRAAPILDGNVARLLSRLFCVEGEPGRAATKRRLWDLAASLVPEEDPSSFNQGLMEIGALVCRPRDPRCGECGLASMCAARRDGVVDLFPARAARARAVDVEVAAVVARDGSGRVLVVRRAEAGAMHGLWELPSAQIAPGARSRAVARRIHAATGIDAAVGAPIATVRHTVMNLRMRVRVFAARVERTPGRHEWVAPHELSRLPHSSLLDKILRDVERAGARGETKGGGV
jgi:A/G-specific adenine glycosylase